MKTLLLTPTVNVRRCFEPVLRSRGRDVVVCTTAAEALRKVQDNIARRRLLDTLTESKARFRALLETAPDAILLVNSANSGEVLIFPTSPLDSGER
jgi:PAS domain-containing protein